MLAWRVCAATSLLKFTAKALPTSDTHYTRRRRFNAEKANLFSDIKQPAQFSSHLAFRTSLLTTSARKINLTPTLARISLLVTRGLFISLLIYLAFRCSLLIISRFKPLLRRKYFW